MAPRTNRLMGFSLAESLVALVIAALLAVALTRFVANTRMNAGKVNEFVEMMALSDSLLERVSLKMPETSDGRTGRFTWHIDVAPMTISAVTRKVTPKSVAAGQSGAKTAGLAPAESNSSSDNSMTESAAGAAPQDPIQWVPVHVTIVIQSPSGRKNVADTVRIISQPSKK